MIFGVTQITFFRRQVFGTSEQHDSPLPLLISRKDLCRKLRKYNLLSIKYVLSFP